MSATNLQKQIFFENSSTLNEERIFSVKVTFRPPDMSWMKKSLQQLVNHFESLLRMLRSLRAKNTELSLLQKETKRCVPILRKAVLIKITINRCHANLSVKMDEIRMKKEMEEDDDDEEEDVSDIEFSSSDEEEVSSDGEKEENEDVNDINFSSIDRNEEVSVTSAEGEEVSDIDFSDIDDEFFTGDEGEASVFLDKEEVSSDENC